MMQLSFFEEAEITPNIYMIYYFEIIICQKGSAHWYFEVSDLLRICKLKNLKEGKE